MCMAIGTWYAPARLSRLMRISACDVTLVAIN
jgi:hypothetical protein